MAELMDFTSYRNRMAAAQQTAAASPSIPGVVGQLPFRAGSVRGGTVRANLPHSEQAALLKLGIGPDDPVPDDLAETITGLIAEARQTEGLLPVSPDTPPLRQPPEILLERLPLEAQAKIRALIAASAEINRQQAAVPAIVGAPPGVNEALRIAATSAEPASVVASAPATPATPAASAAPASPVVSPHSAPVVDSGATAAIVSCPHCGRDASKPAKIEPTVDQKQAYLAMVLGGEFLHSVPLFGGAVILTFRNLSAADGRLAYDQVWLDNTRKPIEGELALLRRLTEYRLALSLTRVAFRGGGSVTIPHATTTDEEPADRGVVTLPTVVAYILDGVLRSESLSRAAFDSFRGFQALVETLEDRAQAADF